MAKAKKSKATKRKKSGWLVLTDSKTNNQAASLVEIGVWVFTLLSLAFLLLAYSLYM